MATITIIDPATDAIPLTNVQRDGRYFKILLIPDLILFVLFTKDLQMFADLFIGITYVLLRIRCQIDQS